MSNTETRHNDVLNIAARVADILATHLSDRFEVSEPGESEGTVGFDMTSATHGDQYEIIVRKR